MKYKEKITKLSDQKSVKECWKEEVENKLNINKLAYFRRSEFSEERLDYMYIYTGDTRGRNS